METRKNDDLGLVWEAAGIAREINRSPRQVYHLLSRKEIKAAKRIGGKWCADRAGLRAQFCSQPAE